MSSTGSIIFFCFGFLFGIILFWIGLSKFRRKKLIENTPTSNIRSIAMGLVEISGNVVADKKNILTSPFSKKDCVYYNYKIEEYRKSGKHSTWVTVKEECKYVYFFVEDNTGTVLVDSKDAEINVSETFKLESGFGKEPTQPLKDFLKNKDMNFKGMLGFNKTMRFIEWAIFPKDKVYVLGTAGDNPYVEEGMAQTSTQDIMIHKDNNIFFISNESEKEILSELGKGVYLFTLGGGAISIACLYFIMLYFNIL